MRHADRSRKAPLPISRGALDWATDGSRKRNGFQRRSDDGGPNFDKRAGVIAAGISVAIIAVVQGLGSKLNTPFTSVQNALN